jgi:homoserine O-acetyltransferase
MTGAALNLVNDKLVLPVALPLDGGQSLPRVEVAFETIGTLNPDKSNAILVFHALTMDQHVVSQHPRTGKPGWWAKSVGPGKVIDTDRYFVICANVLGGCMGSTGPAKLADDGKPWGMRFPVITIRDMVRAQVALLDVWGIDQLHAVIGGSIRPRTSPSTRSAARQSWPTPSGAAATIQQAEDRMTASR